MISLREQNLLTGRKNNVTSLCSISTIDMERMRFDEILDRTLHDIGLARNKNYKVVDLIKILQSKNIKILSLDNNIFPEHFNPDMRDLLTSNFRKKFFTNVLSENKDEESFKKLMDILDDEYILTTIDIKTETAFAKRTGTLSIKANKVEDGTVRLEEKRLVVLSFNY